MTGAKRERRAMTVLSSIDWSFDTPLYSRARSSGLFDCRKHHWYPATFVPEIPYSLIEVLSQPGEVVYDPFGGIGTTVLQALVLGRTPYAIESCRVAVQVVRCMWRLLNRATPIREVERAVDELLRDYRPENRYEAELLETDQEYGPLLQEWFNEKTFREIAFLILEERKQADGAVRAAVWVALSATLKTVAAQERDWGWIADNVRPKPEQLRQPRRALARFARNSKLLLREVESARLRMREETLDLLDEGQAAAHVKHGDSRRDSALGKQKVDLVVSSPPYPNMTDYAASQRLSYYLLGATPDEERKSEIGARARRKRKDALGTYGKDMGRALGRVVEQMRTGAYACFVMPTFAADNIDNERKRRVVEECLANVVAQGLTQVQQLTRLVPPRRHRNRQWTSLERETIHVYRRAQRVG